MARVRLTGGVVPPEDRTVWLAADPGHQVHDARPFAGAPVVVGPAGATRGAVERARRNARRLIAAGGPLAAAAGVDLGHGFRSARLEGAGESRRDAVLAAVEVLGIDGLPRLGERDAVLVALFGPRATKRVGAAAIEALAGGARAPLRLAVALSDLLGPEQLEEVLRLRAPAGIDPVPRADTSALADHLGAVLGPFTPQRRLRLVRSLWDDVADWQRSAQARARARRRRFSEKRLRAFALEMAAQDDRWWRQQAQREIGSGPSPWSMLAWVPQPRHWEAGLRRAFQQVAATTALLRTALATEDQPVEAAVLAHLDQLAYAATAHLGPGTDPVEAVRSFDPIGNAAVDRAGTLARAAVLASEPGEADDDGVDRDDVAALLAEQLRGASELGCAVLGSLILFDMAMTHAGHQVEPAHLAGWRAAAGYGPARSPTEWTLRWFAPAGPALAERLAGPDPAATTAAVTEELADGLWVADLADALAAWRGHERATISWFGEGQLFADIDPPDDQPDTRAPLLETVPLAVAGAAQLVAVGARPPARPASWSALVTRLVAAADHLGIAEAFALPDEIAAWDRQELPGGTELRIETARSPGQLVEWGNYMGNCIASYAEDVTDHYALVALRGADGNLVANLALRRGGLRWRVEEAYARFNEPLEHDVEARLREWARRLRAADPDVGQRPPAAAARRGPRPPRGRRAPARDRLVRAAARLGDAVGDLGTTPELQRADRVLAPLTRQLGWAGDDADWLSRYVAIGRPRRAGPLAAAVARTLDGADACSLADLWEATSYRPVTSASAAASVADGDGPDLSRLADVAVPGSLRLALRDQRLWGARAVEVAAHRVRVAVAELLVAADPRLDRSVVAAPHTGFLTAAVLALTSRGPECGPAVEWLPVASDGSVPGRPRSVVHDPDGPWQAAVGPARELGASTARLVEVLADAPGRHLLVPSPWLANGGWTALWSRAHRLTRALAARAGAR